MQNALLVGLSRQMSLSHELDIVANNIANIDTTGFKSDRATFTEYLMPGPGDICPHDIAVLERPAPDAPYLRAQVRHLRQKIEADPSRPRHLLPGPGGGYRLKLS